MAFKVGETATITLHDKSRPCVILKINPKNQSAVVAVGSTVQKDIPHLTIIGNSAEARQMSLHQTTYFYQTKIFSVDLDKLFPIPRKSSCPSQIFAQLRHMAHQAVYENDDRYTGNYQGHFGSYESSSGAMRELKKPLKASIGDFLRLKK